jgi:DtxR family Mn-dependent transcriptional regulator
LVALADDGLVEQLGDGLRLTEAGKRRASFVIRRQRLGEVLALEIMGFRHMEEKQAVCEFEHVITEDDIDGLCSQLGHPTHCPDKEPIPQGPCCAAALERGNPSERGVAVACALSEVPLGQGGRILYVRRRVPVRARALQSYGILGGTRFELRLRYPALVVFVEGVEVALDTQVASDIFVLLGS